MRTRIAAVLLALATLGLSGCGMFSRNVAHYERAERASLEAAGRTDATASKLAHRVVRVYFDREGDLYPSVGWQVGDAIKHFPDLDSEEGLPAGTPLWTTFAGPPVERCHDLSGACARRVSIPPKSAFWDRLLASEPVREAVKSDEGVLPERTRVRASWAHLQGWFRTEIARQVDDATRHSGGGRRPLLVLVHGFNTGNPDEAFRTWLQTVDEELRDKLRESVVLQVGWDGLAGDVPWAGATIWGKAQYNFPLVGQGLRKLFFAFGSLAQEIDVRILTHSSGGPVVAHLLWDASDAEGRDGDEYGIGATRRPAVVHPYRDYLAREGSGRLTPAPTFKSLRVAMVVPAGPSRLLTRFRSPMAGSVQLLAWGWSERDVAVNKGVGVCGWWGATCLAARREQVCSAYAHLAKIHPEKIAVLHLSGEVSGGNFRWAFKSHGMDKYLSSDPGKALVRGLLEEPRTLIESRNEARQSCAGLPDAPLVEGNNRAVRVVSNNPERLDAEIRIERQWVYRSRP